MQNDKRKRLVEIFQDTQQFYTTNPVLRTSVEESRKGTVLYEDGDIAKLPYNPSKAGVVTVAKSRTFEAAIHLTRKYPDKQIAVLNFASATKPHRRKQCAGGKSVSVFNTVSYT